MRLVFFNSLYGLQKLEGSKNYHRNVFLKGLSHTTSNKSYLSDWLTVFGQKFQLKFENFADICLINTCSVTEKADRKAKKLIKSINRKFPKTKIIVYGCYAQLKPNDIIDMEGVSCVIGDEEKFNIGDIIDENKINKNQSRNMDFNSFKKITNGSKWLF